MASGHPFAIRYPPFALLQIPSFAGLVVLAGSLNPIPSRTRPLNFPAPMVVRLKTRESRSLPGLPRTEFPLHVFDAKSRRAHPGRRLFLFAECAPAVGAP